MSVQDTSSTSEAKTPPPSTEDPWYIRSLPELLSVLESEEVPPRYLSRLYFGPYLI